jgi:hypothetical protein
MSVGIRRADYVTPLYLQKLALTSPTNDGSSVGIVRSRTKPTDILLLLLLLLFFDKLLYDTLTTCGPLLN